MAALLAANESFYSAANAVVAGRTADMERVWSRDEDVSDFGPSGAATDGRGEVIREFVEDSVGRSGAAWSCEGAATFVGDRIGVVTCIEVLTVPGQGDVKTSIRTRATNVFRLEDGQWRMIHRHSDAAVARGGRP